MCISNSTSYIVAALGTQCLRNFSMVCLEVYALYVGGRLMNGKIIAPTFTFLCLRGVSLAIRKSLHVQCSIVPTFTFSSACVCAGVSLAIRKNLHVQCSVIACAQLESAIAFAYMSWLASFPSFSSTL
ncbi:CASP-like protein 5A1 [Impatiens glandulifera]|uniref:CASP-like protein 5A1 n=1 Tax=Impatiens glandulifera TaxID=253017 RepID=UPI001FB19357|nr:CASP-like protein 5A1 [Impatiens glandulifera]